MRFSPEYVTTLKLIGIVIAHLILVAGIKVIEISSVESEKNPQAIVDPGMGCVPLPWMGLMLFGVIALPLYFFQGSLNPHAPWFIGTLWAVWALTLVVVGLAVPWWKKEYISSPGIWKIRRNYGVGYVAFSFLAGYLIVLLSRN
ncbi:MAG: hypothetical protein KDC26_09245 [Armatimonadetes bacterium]|nr:hypothetical protein [Armatimonadota bacterium]